VAKKAVIKVTRLLVEKNPVNFEGIKNAPRLRIQCRGFANNMRSGEAGTSAVKW